MGDDLKYLFKPSFHGYCPLLPSASAGKRLKRGSHEICLIWCGSRSGRAKETSHSKALKWDYDLLPCVAVSEGLHLPRDSVSKTEKLVYAGKSLHLDIFFLEG